MALTLQQVYDNALFGVRKQGRASGEVNEKGSYFCHYRSGDGCKCGIGHSISDDDYDHVMDSRHDGGNIEVLLKRILFKERLKCFEGLPVFALREIQLAHDRAAMAVRHDPGASFMSLFEAKMQDVAASLNLVYTPPDQTPPTP